MPLRDKGPTLVGVLWLEVGMCLCVLGLRIYTRTVIRRSLGVDDLLLIITWVSLSPSCPHPTTHILLARRQDTDWQWG